MSLNCIWTALIFKAALLRSKKQTTQDNTYYILTSATRLNWNKDNLFGYRGAMLFGHEIPTLFCLPLWFCTDKILFSIRTPVVWIAFLSLPLSHLQSVQPTAEWIITFYNMKLEGCCGFWFPPSGLVTEVPQSLTYLIIFALEETLSTIADLPFAASKILFHIILIYSMCLFYICTEVWFTIQLYL